MMFVFLGQATGSSAGSKVFLLHGWRACYTLSVCLSLTAFTVLFARGPVAGKSKRVWFGWDGVWSIRKEYVLKKRAEREEADTVEKEDQSSSGDGDSKVDTMVEEVEKLDGTLTEKVPQPVEKVKDTSEVV